MGGSSGEVALYYYHLVHVDCKPHPMLKPSQYKNHTFPYRRKIDKNGPKISGFYYDTAIVDIK